GEGVAGRERHRDARRAHRVDGRVEHVGIGAALLRRTAPGVVDDVGGELRARVLVLRVRRRQEPLEALDVARRGAVADVHVSAADPTGARRDADRAGLVLADGEPRGSRAVALIVAGRGGVLAAGVQANVLVDGVVPVVVVGGARGGRVPAPVVLLQGGVVP